MSIHSNLTWWLEEPKTTVTIIYTKFMKRIESIYFVHQFLSWLGQFNQNEYKDKKTFLTIKFYRLHIKIRVMADN